MPVDKVSFDSLKKKGWTVPDSQEHILGSLQGKKLGPYRLLLLIGPKNRFGANYFQVFLQNADGETSQQPIIIGLHNQGSYPAYNWIEVISLTSKIEFDSGEGNSFVISSNELFKYLADLLPPGGHMMVEYDSLEQQDTAQSLALGIPPIATPLGYTLYLAGCGASFRDWYFAEGGTEGPRKLQGFKALDIKHAKIKAKETAKELNKFLTHLSSGICSQLEEAARCRALAVIRTLSNTGDNQLHEQSDVYIRSPASCVDNYKF